ncbi:MAG TPA: GAF domain-containing sensor histidine kinase [Ktedonobacteraceae bacterium]|jgi:signal transduction histidine kinase|nr:GAF domain-containing sensor histidine kinase [Ktedonobacteraceae bacterium]
MQNSSEQTSVPTQYIREEQKPCSQQIDQMQKEKRENPGGQPEQQITEWEQEKSLLAEHTRLIELSSAINGIVVSKVKQQELLQRCCEAMVHHLEVSLVCIWTLEGTELILQLQSSAGDATSPYEHEALHELGPLLVEKITIPQQPYIASITPGQSEQILSVRQAFTAFAGYPLIVEEQNLGVLGIFARRPFNTSTFHALSANANAIAIGLAHRRTIQTREQLLAVAQEEQTQAEQALELRNAFLFTVTHDLRSPLTSIIGSAQLLERCIEKYRPPESHKYRQPLEVISASTRRMNTMIEDLLDLACLQMGLQLELKREEGDLIEVARRLVNEHQQNTSKHQLMLQTDLHSLSADYDAPRIERVLANLLSNAIKYSPGGGEIIVNISQQEEDGGWAVISLQDYGIGIPAQDLPYIFEPFHRASNSERNIQGTGLGLTSASQIIEQHGGKISVISKEGQGTIFTIRLPLLTSPAES